MPRENPGHARRQRRTYCREGELAIGYFDSVKPPPGRPPGEPVLTVVTDTEGASRYALAALRGEAEAVAAAAEGTRNATLNKAWFNMGRHVGAGTIAANTVRDTLADAARAAGLPQHEIDTVLRDGATSALRAGTEVPRHPTPLDPAPSVTTVEVEAAEGAEGPPLNPILDWHELFAAEDEEEWIVEPILPARRMVALYSPPKAGKSLLMLEIAVAVARGTEVLGITPDRPRRVLYVDFENDPRGDVRTRLEAMEIGPDALDDLCYLSYPSLAKFDTPQGAVDLMRHVRHYECEVVVIDTVSRAVLGEENDNDTWLAFYRNAGLAMKQAGIACIRLDHSGKDAERGMRGGSAKYGDVDAVWKLTAIADDTIRLECTDHRMVVAEKLLTLIREEWPLRHRLADGDMMRAAMDARAREVDQQLDRIGVPSSASVREAARALRESGYKVENKALREAVRTRKCRLDLPASGVPGTPPAHLGTPEESVPGTGGPLGPVRHTLSGTSGTPRHNTSNEAPDPDALVACSKCFGPTTSAAAERHGGMCAKCANSAGLTDAEGNPA